MKSRISIFVIFVILPWLTFAQGINYKIKYLTADNGLSRNLINYILQDSKGFMWFATNKGLDRYDGYEIIHFNNQNSNNHVRYQNVSCLEEDGNGNFWIGTENGLFFMDYKTGKIILASEKINTTLDFISHSINFIKKDDFGNLWIGYDNGLVKIDMTAEKSVNAEEIYKTKSPFSAVLFINNNIYLSSENKLFRLIKGSNGKYHLINGGENLENFQGLVNVLFSDNGLIWIGTSIGLYKYNPSTGDLKSYQHNPLINSSLSSGYISDIKKSQNGQLLVGTLIGLNIYDYTTDSFSRITASEQTDNGTSLNNNFISNIYVGKENIFIGTEKGGVNILTPDHSNFINTFHSNLDINSLSTNLVNAIYQDEFGDYWIGTVEGGLNVKRKNSQNFIHYYSELGNSNSLSHNSVSCITQDYNGDYWIGTWGKGINRLRKENRNNPVFQQFYVNNSSNSILNDFIAVIVSDSIKSGLWIGTRNGLDFFDLKSEKFIHVLTRLPIEKRMKFVTGMIIDSKQRLWIGTANGLFCVFLKNTDLSKNKIVYKHYQYELSNPSSLRIEKINCIQETKDGTIWLGSSGNGLYRLIEKEGRDEFENFDESNGLPDNLIYGILEDDAGKIWLSTDKGLCSFDPAKKNFISFTKADGLKSNQFYWDSYFKSKNGWLHFGSVEGYSSFDPLKLTSLSTANRVVITRVKILSMDVYPQNAIQSEKHLAFSNNTLEKITLNESEKNISIEFSALSYYLPEKIKYAYRLLGFDNSWTEISSERRFLSFTNLKPGQYKLQIKCNNPDGNWSEQITSVTIKVVPPFYKTWWFLLILTMSALYVAYRYYIYRINLFENQKQKLKKMVDERTIEIEKHKKQLEEQAIQLKNNMESLIEHQEEVSRQNETLKAQNQKITHQKEQLIALSKKVHEANVDKISFFTNITHEFRTPITLILGPVERSLKLSTNPKVIEQLNIVQRNSKLLLSLINQLMDFRKVDSNKMEIVKTQRNFIDFLENIILPFEDLAKDRNIRFIKHFRVHNPEFAFDADNLQKVIGNLFSNAIKFTPDYGAIYVSTFTYIDKKEAQEKLYFAIKDNGIGIPETDFEKIFDRFYQVKNVKAHSSSGQSGTGIGLYLCKKIIDLYHGKIDAKNNSAGGACFRFTIPIERTTNIVTTAKRPASTILEENIIIEETTFSTDKNKPLLLIVEDNADMRLYIKSILKYEFNIIEAIHGENGLDLTNRYQPDIIISDIMMPVMDGLEFCKNVKTNFATSHIPVILLTAKTAVNTQIQSFNLGADAFLVKPFDEELLKAVIKNLNEKKHRLQLNFAENMDVSSLNMAEESQDKKFIDKALKVMKENYTNPEFNVTEFIDAMGVSRSLLHKKLTHLLGQSASRFIRTFRLNIARELIIKSRENHSLNVSEIAYESGFNDPKYFTRCFTKQFGITPSSFLESE
ncbi:Response regulator receiver domain protein [uncultured Paludibacter sp.]|nr:Response regulator receiver domain protein [uncultured Paludibacter sp.]